MTDPDVCVLSAASHRSAATVLLASFAMRLRILACRARMRRAGAHGPTEIRLGYVLRRALVRAALRAAAERPPERLVATALRAAAER